MFTAYLNIRCIIIDEIKNQVDGCKQCESK